MAEDWTDLTTASWDGILSVSELAAITEADCLRELTKMAAEVRAMVGSWQPNALSANPLKIPPGMVARALHIVRNRLLTGMPDYAIDDDRRAQGKSAEEFFLEVARGRIRPQPATDSVPNDAAGPVAAGVEVVSAPPSRTGRTRMDGI